MLNKIWFALLLVGLLYGLGKSVYRAEGDRLLRVLTGPSQTTVMTPDERRALVSDMGKELTTAAVDAATTSVTLAIGLIGVMALWLGFMRVAEDAGLVQALARLLRPVLRLLFPDLPRDHPAGGAIIMNMSANILGLDNAATPLGLKAMKELQTLNPTRDTATNSMAMFLAINTSSITLIPFTIIGWRVTTGSQNPSAPVVAMILATACSTVVAVVACRFLQRFYPPPNVMAEEDAELQPAEKPAANERRLET